MKTDAVLLRDYVEQGSDDAFTELVRRYVNLVHGTAVRCVGGDRHQAEDITQVVFSVLARQARSLTTHPVIAGWLHATTRFTASQTMRAARRRHRREHEAYVMNELCTPESSADDWDRLRPVIDDAVAELNEADRDAILLRFFGGKKFGEIGAVLDASEDAARMRIDRALDKLRAALFRRGITSTSAALSLAMTVHGMAAVPADLASRAVATALGTGGLGNALATSGLLGAGATSKVTAIVGIAAALAAGAVIYQVREVRRQSAVFASAQEAASATIRDAEQRVAALDSERSEQDGETTGSDGASIAGPSGVATSPKLSPGEDEAPKPASLPLPGVTHAAFILDTSGSMRDPDTGGLKSQVVTQIWAVLATNPNIEFVQFLDADGRFILGRAGQWLPNSGSSFAALSGLIERYNIHSNSNPVPGIYRAVGMPWEAAGDEASIGVIILGDEFTEDESRALTRLNEINPLDENGGRRFSISGVGFLVGTDPAMSGKYSNLMEQIAVQHGGSFVQAQ